MRTFFTPQPEKSLPEYKAEAYKIALMGNLLMWRFW